MELTVELSTALAGKKILITRLPQHAQTLMAAIQAQQGVPVCQPLFAIQPLLQADCDLKQRARHADIGIFISRTAVVMTAPFLDFDLNWIWAAVGAGTAADLLRHGASKVLYPQHGAANSRTLLAKLVDSNLNFRQLRCIIFNGADGDPWLATKLRALGATTEVVSVYRRIMPARFVLDPDVDLILISCMTSLINLQALVARKEVPLLVISERIQRAALEMGYLTVYNSNGTTDQAILNGLLQVKQCNKK